MSQKNPQPVRYQPRSFEMVLDFCVELSRRMIMSGANVERVNLAVDRVCSTYELDDVSIFLLPTYVSVSARDRSGYSAVRQASIPAGGINLTRLMSLNRLSYRVKEQRPSPDRLGSLLEKASDTKDYPDPVVIITALMLVIPGIPLTNAVRSMLCGNELSGGMQTMRVTVETMALATGIFLSMVMFSSADLLNNPVGTVTNPFILILLAFGTSFFLGVVFQDPASGPVACRPWRRDHKDRPADPDTPLRKTCLRYGRGVCGLHLRGTARQGTEKAIHLLHLPGDHSTDPRRSVLLYTDRDQPEKQRNGEDQRIRLRADTGLYECRICPQLRHRALCPQGKK